MIDINKYIGLPYKNKGYTKEGLDCYGLVRLFLKEELDVDVPKFEQYDTYENKQEVERQFLLNVPLLAGERTETPEFGDICLFRFMGIVSHIGVYIRDGYVLHILRGTNSSYEAINGRRLKGRLEGYYELKEKNKVKRSSTSV